jgi:hypothetical protein
MSISFTPSLLNVEYACKVHLSLIDYFSLSEVLQLQLDYRISLSLSAQIVLYYGYTLN